MKKINLNKKIIKLIAVILMAVISIASIGTGVYFTYQANEQNKIYTKAMKNIEELEKDTQKGFYSSFFKIDDRIELKQERADEALALKTEYQKYAIIFYCCGGAIICGDIAFVVVSKKIRKKKTAQESEE